MHSPWHSLRCLASIGKSGRDPVTNTSESYVATPTETGISDAALRALKSIVPSNRLTFDPAFQAAFESDGLTAFHQRPLGVVMVESADEVAALVRWCRDFEVPFVARGSGTSLSGGSLPIPGGFVIALNRLNRILRICPIDRVAVVETGGRQHQGIPSRRRTWFVLRTGPF